MEEASRHWGLEWSGARFARVVGRPSAMFLRLYPSCRHVVAGPAACDVNWHIHPPPPQHAFLLLSLPSPHLTLTSHADADADALALRFFLRISVASTVYWDVYA